MVCTTSRLSLLLHFSSAANHDDWVFLTSLIILASHSYVFFVLLLHDQLSPLLLYSRPILVVENKFNQLDEAASLSNL